MVCPPFRFFSIHKGQLTVRSVFTVVTVEPGCYFNPFQLQPFMDSPYLDKEVLERYMSVGGVRIEDE